MAYAKDFPSATFRLNLRGYHMQDTDEQGANKVDGEFQKMVNQNLSFSASGQWSLNRSWITSLEYAAGLTVGYQRNRSNAYYSGAQQVTTNETQPGEHAGVFLLPNYFAALSVEGEPFDC
ncbi:MAG: hypothetical protein LUE99_06575 [Bacteroides sp.]|nr:hypothetical protein [Bacteroides sp.]